MDSPKTLATMVPQDTGNNGPTRHRKKTTEKKHKKNKESQLYTKN